MIECKNIVFVYEKKGKYKVLAYEEALKKQTEMYINSWVHVMTLDAVAWIEYNLNKKK